MQTFTEEHIARLLDECDTKTFVGLRNTAIVLTLLETGLRSSELASVGLDDIDWQMRFIKVMGKGNKERLVPFGESLSNVLMRYLRSKGMIEGTDRVFVSQFGEPMDRYGVGRVIHSLGLKARITGVRVSPHTFRHTFAENWIVCGGDPYLAVQSDWTTHSDAAGVQMCLRHICTPAADYVRLRTLTR